MLFAAILIAGIVPVATDWLFLSRLFAEARGNYPEVWWPSIRDGEAGAAKIWTVLLGFVASAGVVLLVAATKTHGLLGGIEIGFLAFIVPAAFLLTAFQFVKLDLWVMVGAGLAWLSRLVMAGAIAGLITP